jgi:hypothetical protein
MGIEERDANGSRKRGWLSNERGKTSISCRCNEVATGRAGRKQEID